MIRKGKIDDSIQISKLKIDNYRKTYKGIFPNEYIDSLLIENEKEKYIAQFKNRNILVYEENNEILGYIYYGKRKNFGDFYKDCDGEIYAIYVKIGEQNKGIGTQLIKEALKDLIKEFNKVILWCVTENRNSMKFYKDKNFEQGNIATSKYCETDISETSYIYDFQDISKYKLTRYCSYIKKNEIIALYANLNLIFLKKEPAKWFNSIVYKNYNEEHNIPTSFYNYLIEKEVIEFV